MDKALVLCSSVAMDSMLGVTLMHKTKFTRLSFLQQTLCREYYRYSIYSRQYKMLFFHSLEEEEGYLCAQS